MNKNPFKIFDENLARQLFVDWDIDDKVISIERWMFSLNTELRHNFVHGYNNSSLIYSDEFNEELLRIALITLNQLYKSPYYYTLLVKMERKENRYWKGKKKPPPIK